MHNRFLQSEVCAQGGLVWVNVWEISREEWQSPVLLQVNGQKNREREQEGGGGGGGGGWVREGGWGGQKQSERRQTAG